MYFISDLTKMLCECFINSKVKTEMHIGFLIFFLNRLLINLTVWKVHCDFSEKKGKVNVQTM